MLSILGLLAEIQLQMRRRGGGNNAAAGHNVADILSQSVGELRKQAENCWPNNIIAKGMDIA